MQPGYADHMIFLKRRRLCTHTWVARRILATVVEKHIDPSTPVRRMPAPASVRYEDANWSAYHRYNDNERNVTERRRYTGIKRCNGCRGADEAGGYPGVPLLPIFLPLESRTRNDGRRL
jgi:hypothetical protein